MEIKVLDTTLRDGAQGEGISFSVQDKLNILLALDELGVAYVEAGNPASNPKDAEFFETAKSVTLKNAELCAFGSTHRKGVGVERDEGVAALLKTGVGTISIFGKASASNAETVLGVSARENLKLIEDTIAYLTAQGKNVIFDAEHYFDGFKEDEEYALEVVRTASAAGATSVCLCDTNGGTLPFELAEIVKATVKSYPDVILGIHCHNDSGCAVANSIIAVECGVREVQGTLIGIGERCGNTELSAVIAGLTLKKQVKCIKGDLKMLRDTAVKLAEISNISLSPRCAYVGESAFAHKGGMHIDGMLKNANSFEHIEPQEVGNKRRFLNSEVAGRHATHRKLLKLIPDIKEDDTRVTEVLKRLKEKEYDGYQYESADASFELLVLETIGRFVPHFKLDMYKTSGEYPAPDGEMSANALIKVKVGKNTETAGAVGNGPVNALDKAMRRALSVFYPSIVAVHLIDYKVRVLTSEAATAAKVRVLIESTDGERVWTTVGVSTDIIEASWIALKDSIEYILYIKE